MVQSNNAEETRYYYLALLEENNRHEDQDLMCISGKEYGIHGLWPQINKDLYPQYCRTDIVFNEQALDPIKSELDKYWHSNQRSDEDFWKHEWLKHGSCTNPVLSEFDFFSKTLALYKWVRNRYDDGDIEIQRYFNQEERRFCIPFDLKFNLLSSAD